MSRQSRNSNILRVSQQHRGKISVVKGTHARTSSILPYKLDSGNSLQNNPPFESRKSKEKKESASTLDTEDIHEGVKKARLNRLARLSNQKYHRHAEANKVLSSIHKYLLQDYDSATNKRYLYNLYLGVEYSLKRLREPSPSFIQEKSKYLYESTHSHQKFLFMDLDQTLLSSQSVKDSKVTNFTNIKIIIRPYTFSFLEQLSAYFEIYAFTTSSKAYAQAAVQRLNKEKLYIKDVLTRENCFVTKKGNYIKDLRIIKNRELKDIVIIDNSVESFGLQINNGIPILSYNGEEEDSQLSKLLPFLRTLSKADDVRPLIRDKFNLTKLLQIQKADVHYFFETLWNEQ